MALDHGVPIGFVDVELFREVFDETGLAAAALSSQDDRLLRDRVLQDQRNLQHQSVVYYVLFFGLIASDDLHEHGLKQFEVRIFLLIARFGVLCRTMDEPQIELRILQP